MSIAYIGLGSNIGNRGENLKKAVEMLDRHRQIKVVKRSSIYETAPVGYTDQPDFLNAVVGIETILSPRELLKVTKAIEEELKRKRKIKWGPRTIDLDILLYDNLFMDEQHLKLPHPEITNRAFVLVPLFEIAAGLTLPGGKKIQDLIKEIPEDQQIKKAAKFN